MMNEILDAKGQVRKASLNLVKRLIIIILLALLWQTGCRGSNTAQVAPPAEPQPQQQVEPPLQALQSYKETLVARGYDLQYQGVLIETPDGQKRLAEHNSDIQFNPASVMKLVTSLVALAKFSPSHRYQTNFLADGPINQQSRTIEGDLVVEGGADPMFSVTDAQEVAQELSRVGVSRVSGSLRIAGPFYYFATGYKSNLSPGTSAEKLRRVFERAGIRIAGKTLFGEKSGTLLVSHYSEKLAYILLYQNAHSSNAVAEVVGESVGGALEIQRFLINSLKLRDDEIYVSHASGLEFNRITPSASLKVMRALLGALNSHSMKPEDVMPVAGIDSGTLRTRLYIQPLRGSVVAKTGTLVSIDNGVSTLVGIAYTKERGPLLFAIFNSVGNVNAYRHLQDRFVEDFIEEKGGPVPVSRTEDALAGDHKDSLTKAFYGNEKQPGGSATH